jgi:hypothetical protein
MTRKLSLSVAVLLAAMSIAGSCPAAPAGVVERVDFVTHNAILIKASAAAIWPHILSLDWKRGAKLVPTNQAPDLVGGTFDSVEMDGVVDHRVENVEMAPGHIRTIRLTEVDGALIGYASWRLTAQGRSTLVQYDVYCFPKAVDTPDLPPAEIATAKRRYLEDNLKRFDEELALLKAMVEAHP